MNDETSAGRTVKAQVDRLIDWSEKYRPGAGMLTVRAQLSTVRQFATVDSATGMVFYRGVLLEVVEADQVEEFVATAGPPGA